MSLDDLSQQLNSFKPIRNFTKKSMFERLDVHRYESLSSRMLEFLFNSDEEHDIGDLAIITLLEELELKAENPLETLECLSEIHATSDKYDVQGFIDLVVSLRDFTLIIENKVNHICNNPFDLYEEYANKTYTKKNGYSGKNIFIIMGLVKPKKLPKSYMFVSHESFCLRLSKKLDEYFGEKAKDKFYYFIQDYIEAVLEMSNTELKKEKEEFFDFITTNYQKLDVINKQQKYIFDIARARLEEIIEFSNYKNEFFGNSKAQKNNDSSWENKGYFISSNGVKKVFNGSEIYVAINAYVRGISLSIAIHDNRKKEYYSQTQIKSALKGYRILSSSETVEQVFDYDVIIKEWGYKNFEPIDVAKSLDKLIDKIINTEFTR